MPSPRSSPNRSVICRAIFRVRKILAAHREVRERSSVSAGSLPSGTASAQISLLDGVEALALLDAACRRWSRSLRSLSAALSRQYHDAGADAAGDRDARCRARPSIVGIVSLPPCTTATGPDWPFIATFSVGCVPSQAPCSQIERLIELEPSCSRLELRSSTPRIRPAACRRVGSMTSFEVGQAPHEQATPAFGNKSAIKDRCRAPVLVVLMQTPELLLEADGGFRAR
jgi:hypothetical protein